MDKERKIEIRKAIKAGDLEKVKEMLEANKELLFVETPFGSWLHVASNKGHLAIVKYLVEQGLDINKIGGMGECSSIKEASREGHLEVVKYLIENGGELDTSLAIRNPLFGAIYNGHLDVVKYLVEQGLDISIKYNGKVLKNMNAYDYADQFGQMEIAEYLKEVMEKKNI